MKNDWFFAVCWFDDKYLFQYEISAKSLGSRVLSGEPP
jgi:hypothetical protein